jgi:hypothetical protein
MSENLNAAKGILVGVALSGFAFAFVVAVVLIVEWLSS